MKKLRIEITRTMDLDVEDEFPIDAAYMQRIMALKANTAYEGRHAFSTELICVGVRRLVEDHIHETISQYLFDKLGGTYGPKGLEERTRIEENLAKMVGRLRGASYSEGEDGPLRIAVTEV